MPYSYTFSFPIFDYRLLCIHVLNYLLKIRTKSTWYIDLVLFWGQFWILTQLTQNILNEDFKIGQQWLAKEMVSLLLARLSLKPLYIRWMSMELTCWANYYLLRISSHFDFRHSSGYPFETVAWALPRSSLQVFRTFLRDRCSPM